MKNILVSGASGIVGYGILRSLKKSDNQLKLIATSIYTNSVAEVFCDVFEQAVPTISPEYPDWLFDTIKKNKVDLLIPGIEVDLYKWVEFPGEIKKSGATILLNNIELISLTKDKWIFFENFNKTGSPQVIESSLSSDFEKLALQFGLPFLLKPRKGFGSKGIVIVNDHETFLKHKDAISTVLMAQPIMGDVSEEYTTSAFGDGSGGFYASMTMKRKLSKDGFTEKAEVVDKDQFDDVLAPICKHFKPVGPTNFQFRKHDGVLKLLEINPRISSSTSIRTAFGYNECAMAVDYFLNGKIPSQPLIKKGKAIRYTEDFIIYE